MTLDEKSTAFLFPGQGSQTVGMGKALAEKFHVARQTFEEADDVLEIDLSRLCFEGPEDELTDTINAQPALYTAGIAALRTLYEELDGTLQPAYVAGHSLGELTALTAAGALSFPDGLRLVRRRGELMRTADEHSPGGMTAVLGLSAEDVQKVCEQASEAVDGVVVLANDNCPGQIVIAGDEDALAHAMALASEVGAKRAIRLPVSIAAHSPLMARVQSAFREALEDTTFHPPAIPIIGNTQARPLTTVPEIREELGAQLTSPVRWTESVQHMIADGVTEFVELGSKNVLVGLLKRIDRSVNGHVVDAPDGIATITGG
jgi:[acyl-carrier-protein] S-malonyltransferase